MEGLLSESLTPEVTVDTGTFFSTRRWPVLAALIVVTALIGTVGCTPKVLVRKSPGDHDGGVRYYRPKPYLKIEPAEIAVSKTESKIAPGLVRVSLVYLPDFSEEYSISVRSGLGVADVGIKLEDGWNLTEISQELDSQTDENVKAMGSLLSAVGGLIPTSTNQRVAENVSFTVPARNVPIGFYESVVGRDPCNVKRLYGFRYLGFMPFAGCPVEMHGHSHASCQDPGACGQHPAGSLYGLTFAGGEMVFQPLDVMAVTPAVSAHATGEKQSTQAPVNPPGEIITPSEASDAVGLETRLRAHLTALGMNVNAVDATSEGDSMNIRITIPPDTASAPVREAIDDWLQSHFPDLDMFVVQIESDNVL